MADEEQGVKVQAVDENGRREERNHPRANAVAVHDGHLLVQDTGRGKNVAIYAPGKWVSAVVDR